MKKILVVLLILAVAGGVFAQGSWSLGGNVEIGARINLDTDTDTANPRGAPEYAMVGPTAYNAWDNIRGIFKINYSNGGANAYLRFNTRDAGGNNENGFSYSGDNFDFQAEIFGNALFANGYQWGSALTQNFVSRLWGGYNFLDGIIYLEVAAASKDQRFWESDTTAGLNPDGTNNFNHQNRNDHNFFGKSVSFTKMDHHSMLLAAVRLDAIDFGIILPQLFNGMPGHGYQSGMPSVRVVNDENGNSREKEFVQGVLKQSIFGLKFQMHPIEFAMQFKFQDFGAYVGAKFSTGPVDIGLSFSGILSPEEDAAGVTGQDRVLKAGGEVAYNGGVFGAGIQASYERNTDMNTDIFWNLARIQPKFYFNAIPNHLNFAIDAGFYFWSQDDGGDTTSDVTWAVQPMLTWNFLGTGANKGYSWAGSQYIGNTTGMIFRYRLASDRDEDGWTNWTAGSTLDVIFTFNF